MGVLAVAEAEARLGPGPHKRIGGITLTSGKRAGEGGDEGGLTVMDYRLTSVTSSDLTPRNQRELAYLVAAAVKTDGATGPSELSGESSTVVRQDSLAR